ncbi:hypothetical protein [Streptomyces sp. NPDC029041]|uniref:hypothetical protein n=1 Tax=Streptomyces sp. NPDC029041 TaxID=3155727 RepID=UPI0033D959C5
MEPTSLHTDPARRTGYLLASLVGAEWAADPRTRDVLYRVQLARIADGAAEK